MGISKVMDNLKKAKRELLRRSVSNLTNNHNLAPDELSRECRKQGWLCLLSGDDVWIAKTEAAVAEFKEEHEVDSYDELI